MSESLTRKLSFLDRYLTLWIFLAMAAGVALGCFAAGAEQFINRFQVGTTNIPIADRADPDDVPAARQGALRGAGRRLPQLARAGLSLVQNWVIGPVADVRARGPLPARLSRVHGRPDHDRPGPLHRHGDRVERAGEGRHRVRGGAGRLQLRLPGALLQRLRLGLHHRAAPLVRARGQRGRRHHGRRSPRASAIYLGIPFVAGMLTRFVLLQRQRPGVVRASASSRASARSRSWRCCSPSWSCSRSRARLIVQLPLDVRAHRDPAARSTSC